MTLPGTEGDEDRRTLLRSSVLELFADDPAREVYVDEIRVHVWDRLPDEVRSSWRALQAGDQLSRVMTKLREQELLHSRRRGFWRLGPPPRHEQTALLE